MKKPRAGSELGETQAGPPPNSLRPHKDPSKTERALFPFLCLSSE